MCSHYVGLKARERLSRFGFRVSADWEMPPGGGMHIYPMQTAPIIRRPPELDSGDEAVPPMELVPARFGLLPGFAKDIKYGLRTYNARAETVASLASFKHAWAKARHCIIPAEAIYEPDWRTGKHIPTRISRADGETMGVAGLWSPWKSPTEGWINSFTMLTINADTHPIFQELHRPDPKRPPHMQDKRMVVILHDEEYDAWLDAPPEKSMDFLRQYPREKLIAEPDPKEAEPQLFEEV